MEYACYDIIAVSFSDLIVLQVFCSASLQVWLIISMFWLFLQLRLNELMESKGGKKKSSSSSSSSSKSLFYEAPLGYSIEDVRPHGGIKKFRSAAYSNVSC